MLAFGFVVYLFILMTLGVVWSGYALASLWGWFVVPALGAPVLSIPAAIGISILLHYSTWQDSKRGDEGKSVGGSIVRSAVLFALRPAIALCVGWVVAQWM